MKSFFYHLKFRYLHIFLLIFLFYLYRRYFYVIIFFLTEVPVACKTGHRHVGSNLAHEFDRFHDYVQRDSGIAHLNHIQLNVIYRSVILNDVHWPNIKSVLWRGDLTFISHSAIDFKNFYLFYC